MENGIERTDARLKQHVGAIIKFHRVGKNWSQDAVCHELGVNRSYLSKVESGAVCASLDMLVKITRVLEIDPNLYFQPFADSPFESAETASSDLIKSIVELDEVSVTPEATKIILSNLELFNDQKVVDLVVNLLRKQKVDA